MLKSEMIWIWQILGSPAVGLKILCIPLRFVNWMNLVCLLCYLCSISLFLNTICPFPCSYVCVFVQQCGQDPAAETRIPAGKERRRGPPVWGAGSTAQRTRERLTQGKFNVTVHRQEIHSVSHDLFNIFTSIQFRIQYIQTVFQYCQKVFNIFKLSQIFSQFLQFS